MRDFEFGRHDHHLLVQIRVPLTTFDEDFLVFKVSTLPMPLTGRETHGTSVLDLPRYFVISQSGLSYFSLSHDYDSIRPLLF